jgi:hypothetical protein
MEESANQQRTLVGDFASLKHYRIYLLFLAPHLMTISLAFFDPFPKIFSLINP